MKFKIGDYIICDPNMEEDIPYSCTNSFMTKGEVIDIDDDNGVDCIKVKILEHDHPWKIGGKYWVNPKFFIHWRSHDEREMREWL